MSCTPKPVDGRSAAAIRVDVLRKRPGYTPEWLPRESSPGSALLDVFADHAALFARGLDELPARSKLAFLDAIATQLLPAQPARVPVVFVMQDNAPVDVTVPADTLVTADVAPPPPSPIQPAAAGTSILFATEAAFLATRAKLTTLYSAEPGDDEIADHSAGVESGFSAFEDMQPAEHALYIGHDELLQLKGDVELLLSVELAPKAPASNWELALEWEYYSDAGWFPFELLDDQTESLRRNGTVALRRRCGPDVSKATFGGRTSYWIRGRLTSPLSAQAGIELGEPPMLDLIQLQVRFSRSLVTPEHLFHESSRLDPQSDFEPLGAFPVAPTSFHIASREAFERPLARVHLSFEVSQPGADDLEGDAPWIDWDYHDGSGWRALTDHDLLDETAMLTKSIGTVSFERPEEWKETALHGESSLWMRGRLTKGDYGHPLRVTAVDDGSGGFTLQTEPATLVAPRVAKLTLGYAYVTDPKVADHCLTYNDSAFTDVTEASQWRRSPFQPFVPLSNEAPALYFGFDRPLETGLISMFVHVSSTPDYTLVDADSDFEWEYYCDRGWTELMVLDETVGLRQSGMIQWIGPPDMAARSVIGGERYLVRARLKRGVSSEARPIDGIWLNATWASQREVVVSDILGHSDGRSNQTFELLRGSGSVLERVDVDVREWWGEGRDWQEAAHALDMRDVRLVEDQATGDVTEVWVRWRTVDHLHGSEPGDRHCVVERARGFIGFGDGERGMVPPVGARIVASYDAGGGVLGNVAARAIKRVQGVIPFVAEVFNPIDASGGAEIETVEAVALRGPQHVRHRQRAVCETDYEWLAKEASPAVKRARCQGLLGPDGFAQRGWVTVHIVPDGESGDPQPSPELLRRVREHLAALAPAVVAGRIRVLGPVYLPVDVLVEIVPRRPEDAAAVEARVRQTIDRFLHPTRGGVRGDGWRFGESLYLSWLALRLERTEGVDHAARLRLRVDGVVHDDHVEVPVDRIVAAGSHELRLTLEGR